MSSRNWIFRIQDILAAIDKIEQYIKDLNFTQFHQNELIIDAVVRNFEIIGETGKGVPLEVRRIYSKIPWNQLCGMRDVLIHEYFGVNIKILWHTAKKELPTLRMQLQDLLAKENVRKEK